MLKYKKKLKTVKSKINKNEKMSKLKLKTSPPSFRVAMMRSKQQQNRKTKLATFF